MLTENELKDSLHKEHLSRRDKVLLILSVDCDNPKNSSRIKELARSAGLPEIYMRNLADILAKAKKCEYAVKLSDGWMLTPAGRNLVHSFGGTPSN